MTFNPDTRVRLFVGMPGSGKTFLFSEQLKDMDRLIVFDPAADYKLASIKAYPRISDIVPELRKDAFRIRLESDSREMLEAVSEICWNVGNVTLAVDELSLFCGPNSIGYHFGKALRLGRHRRVNVLGTTQRPADIHTIFKSVANQWFLFQTYNPRDIDYLSSFAPNAERLLNLAQYARLEWTPGEKEGRIINGKA